MPGKKKGTEKSQSGAFEETEKETFPVVCLGASAGGLKALKSFFSKLPEKSGIAYVVVVHLSPNQPSMLPELLQKCTPVPVSLINDGQSIQPDHVYVISAEKDIAVFQGKFQLLDQLDREHHLPINAFLRSLAQDMGEKAGAVILSGTGTDGSEGIRDISSSGGLVMAQTKESAEYDGMPVSAVNTGVVNIVLPPEEMPQAVVHYFGRTRTFMDQKVSLEETQEGGSWLNKIFAILRNRTGHDFSVYKENTIIRRITRRMALNQLDDHAGYVRLLQENPAEVDSLFKELLIGVTSFFRDPESFEALKSKALPGLFAAIPEGGSFRAWVPGCSTGEEVYSLAIILQEYLDGLPGNFSLQLFATDIDTHAIEKAREGLFSSDIRTDVSDERLKKFFVREGDRFRVSKAIRDCIIFSTHDILKDPPFSRLNLLCCRNVLIYFGAEAQKKVLPLFHYTLVPGGILMLGSSETVGGFTSHFESLVKKWKIFKRKSVSGSMRHLVDFPNGTSRPNAPHIQESPETKAIYKPNIAQSTQQEILNKFSPAAVLIDADGTIQHIQGHIGKYLEHPSGPPTYNILNLARPGLGIELSSALRAAITTQAPVLRKHITLKGDGDTVVIDLHVCPQKKREELAGRYLVVFEDMKEEVAVRKKGPKPEQTRVIELEKELQFFRENHQTTVEELESSNEELKSTNEELQSSNEELQSANEELESSKEELQSLNEELQTLNAELQSKVDELSLAHDDMHNLLDSMEIATIFVDNSRRIRRFTAEAPTIVNLIQGDIGRPLEHVTSNLTYEGMIPDLKRVLQKLTPAEVEVQTTEGIWYAMRIIPYRTTDNRIDGAVLTFMRIDEQKKVQESLGAMMDENESMQALVRSVFDIHEDPMLVLDAQNKMVIANTAFSRVSGIPQDLIEGMDPFASKASWLQQLEPFVKKGENFKTPPVTLNPQEKEEIFTIHGSMIQKSKKSARYILLHFLKAE